MAKKENANKKLEENIQAKDAINALINILGKEDTVRVFEGNIFLNGIRGKVEGETNGETIAYLLRKNQISVENMSIYRQRFNEKAPEIIFKFYNELEITSCCNKYGTRGIPIINEEMPGCNSCEYSITESGCLIQKYKKAIYNILNGIRGD
jgi:hypothetical protein